MIGSRPASLASSLLLYLLLGLVEPPLRAESYQRQSHVDVIGYRFGIEVYDRRDEILGDAEIRVRWLASGATTLDLDLVARGDDGSGMVVDSVLSRRAAGNVLLKFEHAGERLRILLDGPTVEGEIEDLSVSYHGLAKDGLVIGPNRYGERTFFGDNWPDRAHHWLPTIDHPSDKALCSFAVTAPARYQVVGCGRLVEETDLDSGRRLTVWSSDVPMATKVMTIGVARFAVQRLGQVAGVELETWVYPQDRDSGFFDFERAANVVRFFSERIGPFPYQKIANVQSRTRFGGLENASNIFYAENSVRGDRSNEGLIAHELAHQWFGDSVTETDWHHVWLSEGFATYLAEVYFEFTYGRDRFVDGMREARERVIADAAERPTSSVIDLTIDDPNRLLTPASYQKGAWTLHMLRREIGDEAFFVALREFYRRYRDHNASSADFRQVVEEVAGRDLRWFFEQWLERSGQPEIAGSWSWNPESRELSVTLRQAQKGDPYRLRVEVAVYTGVGSDRHRFEVELADREATEVFVLDQAPRGVTVDPDVWLLAEFQELAGPAMTTGAR